MDNAWSVVELTLAGHPDGVDLILYPAAGGQIPAVGTITTSYDEDEYGDLTVRRSLTRLTLDGRFRDQILVGDTLVADGILYRIDQVMPSRTVCAAYLQTVESGSYTGPATYTAIVGNFGAAWQDDFAIDWAGLFAGEWGAAYPGLFAGAGATWDQGYIGQYLQEFQSVWQREVGTAYEGLFAGAYAALYQGIFQGETTHLYAGSFARVWESQSGLIFTRSKDVSFAALYQGVFSGEWPGAYSPAPYAADWQVTVVKAFLEEWAGQYEQGYLADYAGGAAAILYEKVYEALAGTVYPGVYEQAFSSVATYEGGGADYHQDFLAAFEGAYQKYFHATFAGAFAADFGVDFAGGGDYVGLTYGGEATPYIGTIAASTTGPFGQYIYMTIWGGTLYRYDGSTYSTIATAPSGYGFRAVAWDPVNEQVLVVASASETNQKVHRVQSDGSLDTGVSLPSDCNTLGLDVGDDGTIVAVCHSATSLMISQDNLVTWEEIPLTSASLQPRGAVVLHDGTILVSERVNDDILRWDGQQWSKHSDAPASEGSPSGMCLERSTGRILLRGRDTSRIYAWDEGSSTWVSLLNYSSGVGNGMGVAAGEALPSADVPDVYLQTEYSPAGWDAAAQDFAGYFLREWETTLNYAGTLYTPDYSVEFAPTEGTYIGAAEYPGLAAFDANVNYAAGPVGVYSAAGQFSQWYSDHFALSIYFSLDYSLTYQGATWQSDGGFYAGSMEYVAHYEGTGGDYSGGATYEGTALYHGAEAMYTGGFTSYLGGGGTYIEGYLGDGGKGVDVEYIGGEWSVAYEAVYIGTGWAPDYSSVGGTYRDSYGAAFSGVLSWQPAIDYSSEVDYSNEYVGEFEGAWGGAWYLKEYAGVYDQDFQAAFGAPASDYGLDVSYTAAYAGAYAQYYLLSYSVDYQADGTTSDFEREWGSHFEGSYQGDYQAPFQRSYIAEYVGQFGREWAADYGSDTAKAFTGTFSSSWGSIYAGEWERVYSASFQRVFVGVWDSQATQAYVGEYASDWGEFYAGEYEREQLQSWLGEYGSHYVADADYQRDFTAGFASDYQDDFGAVYSAEYEAVYVAEQDYVSETGVYTGAA